MKTQTPFKRLILRAVLRKVSPMVILVLAVPDYLDLSRFDEVFRALLGWDGLVFSFHIHGQGFTSFLRRTRAQRKGLRDFQLRPRETFLYTCGGIDLWCRAALKFDNLDSCPILWHLNLKQFG